MRTRVYKLGFITVVPACPHRCTVDLDTTCFCCCQNWIISKTRYRVQRWCRWRWWWWSALARDEQGYTAAARTASPPSPSSSPSAPCLVSLRASAAIAGVSPYSWNRPLARAGRGGCRGGGFSDFRLILDCQLVRGKGAARGTISGRGFSCRRTPPAPADGRRLDELRFRGRCGGAERALTASRVRTPCSCCATRAPCARLPRPAGIILEERLNAQCCSNASSMCACICLSTAALAGSSTTFVSSDFHCAGPVLCVVSEPW